MNATRAKKGKAKKPRKSNYSKYSAQFVAINQMRSTPEYRAAELLRRKVGTARMAAEKNSAEYAAVRLLIGTWDAIAATTRGAEQGYLELIFARIPICHMYEALREAIVQIRNDLGNDFAMDFETLYNEYLAWLDKHGMDANYRAQHCGGLHAMFG